jgi:hypothetical protein
VAAERLSMGNLGDIMPINGIGLLEIGIMSPKLNYGLVRLRSFSFSATARTVFA